MMLFKRPQRELPGLDTTSTADISFMLLIFFLVTSSMDARMGLQRRLPPANDGPQEELAVQRSNVLELTLLADGSVQADGTSVSLEELSLRIEALVRERGDQHILSLKADSMAPYGCYYRLQETIVATYRRMGVAPRISESS